MNPSYPPRAAWFARLTPLWLLLLLVAGCGGGSGGGTLPNGTPPTLPPPAPPMPTPPPTGGNEIVDLTAATGTFAGEVVLRFTAPTPAATAYEVRAQVPHLTPDNALAAPIVPQTYAPGAAGTQEAIALSGLELDQTLQFAVRPIRSGTPGAFSHGAGARVRPPGPPTAPAGAVTLFAPATLSQDNTYYRLGSDIVASGTAFQITGRGITLDLGGRTITYGTGGGQAYGVQVLAPLNSGTTTVTNGTIRQSTANTANYSDAVEVGGGHHHRISHLDVTVQGPGAHCVWIYNIPTGTTRVDHCTLNCNTTTVVNRHYPGVSAIYIEDATESVQVDHNHITNSPQWGILVAGNSTTGDCWIHHNIVTGTKALVANGYMLGIHKPDALVFENICVGESRGLHLDGVDGHGNNAYIHDNDLDCQDQPNAEFSPHWCHGIKVENPTSATIVHNEVTVTADPTHSEALGIDIDVEDGGDVLIYGNRISGLSSSTTDLGKGVSWLGGSAGTTPDILQFCHNVVRATDQLVDRGWYAENGAPFMQNAWVRDFSKLGNTFWFEVWAGMPVTQALGHRYIDPWTTLDVNNVTEFGAPGAYLATREWTLSILVQDGSAQPVPGATVTVRDRSNAVVFNGTTDALGAARPLLVASKVTTGPLVDLRGPFGVSVSAAAGSYSGSVSLTKAIALRVNLSAGTALLDAVAPTAPGGVYAVPLSASRAVIRWAPATDASGISHYLVYKDGQLERITNQLEAVVSGLSPSTTVALTVVAVDRGGNSSPATPAVFVTTPIEDRGP